MCVLCECVCCVSVHASGERERQGGDGRERDMRRCEETLWCPDSPMTETRHRR